MDTKKFFVSSFVTYVCTSASVLLTAGFYVTALRLGEESFGALQSSLSFLFLLNAGMGIAGSYIVIHTGGDSRNLPTIFRSAIKLSTILSLTTAAIFATLAPVLRDFLHVPSAVPFAVMGISAIPGMIAGMANGLLNVQRRFGLLALSTLLTPLASIGIALLLFHDGLDPYDAGWIVLGSQIIHCCAVVFFVDWSFIRQLPVVQQQLPLVNIVPLLTTSLLLGASLRMDVSWARHLLSSDLAGAYATCASIASVLHLLGSGIARISSVSLRGSTNMRIITFSYALIIGIATIVGAIFGVIGEPLLTFLVGRDMSIDWNVLLPLFIAAPCITVIMLDFSCLNIVTKHVHVGISVVLVIVQGGAIYLFGTSTSTIAWARAGTMVSLMLVFSVLLYRTAKNNFDSTASSQVEPHLVPNA